jgi:hypothetical protein
MNLQAIIDQAHEALRVDLPGEDKHQLAVRVMGILRPAAAPLTMETHEGFKGSD